MPSIKIINEFPPLFLLQPAFERMAYHIACKEQIAIKCVSVIVTDDAKLNELKKQYFGEDLITDTISFNYNEPGEPIEGEIYLSIDRIRENAQKIKCDFEKELANVFIHSLLHLLGYNDDTVRNSKQMFALQNFYLHQMNTTRLYRNRSKPTSKNND
ncbi:MAG: rRNA maturation RNase YbeY [Candidatus Marinimicrobia bacterium CG08_land_8_20_14_0_20_45_22]|nr:MAG: rRNA maturation RNase YbeY [Candidatus Marinimicrobia bacterium CG08_land_8_20_14_0_20_45_22]